jgi:hypothetical protein
LKIMLFIPIRTLCLLNPNGEIGSEYPTMSMMVIGISLPILRLRWCCLLYDVLTAGWLLFMGQNTWNTIPVSEHKSTLNNQTLNSRTMNRTKKNTESNKRKQNELQLNNKLTITKQTLNH